MESPRLFRFALLHENMAIRAVAMLVAVVVVVALVYRIAIPYILGRFDWYLLFMFLLAAVLLVAMANLLLIAWDKGNFILVGEEAITFTVRRPNTSPLHLTILLSEVASVGEFHLDHPVPYAGVRYDERTDALMLYSQSWSKNIVLNLREPKHVAWTQLRRFIVPRLRRSRHSFRRVVFAASPHEECLEAIRRAYDRGCGS